MQALRAIAFTLFQVITVVPVGIVCLLCAPLPRPLRYRVTITSGRGGSGEVRIAFSDLYQLEDIVDRLIREPALQS